MAEWVLDASALTAFLEGEPGAGRVEAMLDEAVMSAVNVSEVLKVVQRRSIDPEEVLDEIISLGIQLYPFDGELVLLTAQFDSPGRELGLSLADRACLATATHLQLAAVTADRAWSKIEGPEVVLIR